MDSARAEAVFKRFPPVDAFCRAHGLRLPILLAPMAGACPPALSAAVANAGGLGACGALMMTPDAILAWATDVRAASNGGFQMNLWIPDPAPVRDADHEDRVRAFLGQWGPAVAAAAGDGGPLPFEAQCDALIEARPPVVSSIMGLYPPGVVAKLKASGIKWFATATTVDEAERAEAAGADAIVAQGSEAGGHRGAFDAAHALDRAVGLAALVPAIVDAVRVPVVATGGIADGRGIAAALALGASAVQIGTGLLRTPEAGLAPAWADGIARTPPEGTALTRAFSGRLGRAIATGYVRAANAAAAPVPAPYPVQRGLTQAMRDDAVKTGDLERMQAWAGQSARLARALPARDLVGALWNDACRLLAD